jgi:hypothetical protein
MSQIQKRIQQIETGIIGALFLSFFIFVVLLIGVKWPNYWQYIASEQTPMTWFQSVILFSCSLTALACASLSYIDRGWHKRVWVWGTLSLSFLFLTLDERFAMHERVRDLWLKPANIRIPLPWVGPGDFILLIYLILGLGFVFYIYQILKERKSVWVWFCIGLALSTLAVAIDSFDVAMMTLSQERFFQSVEEIIESVAMLSMWSSFILMSSTYIGKLYDDLALHKS